MHYFLLSIEKVSELFDLYILETVFAAVKHCTHGAKFSNKRKRNFVERRIVEEHVNAYRINREMLAKEVDLRRPRILQHLQLLKLH